MTLFFLGGLLVKKIIIMLLFIGLPILIYLMTVNNKIYYVALGDSLAAGQNPYGKTAYGYADYVADNLKSKNKLAFYTKKFAVSGYRTVDLIHDINTNKKVLIEGEEITIKHALTKADVVTISIGANDLFYKMGINSMDLAYYSEIDLKRYVDEVVFDIEKLVVLVQKYCKEDIILVGYYNPIWHMKKSYAKEIEPVFVYANDKMKTLSEKYKVYYVDIHKLFSDSVDFLPNPLDIHPNEKGYNAISDKIMNIIGKQILK